LPPSFISLESRQFGVTSCPFTLVPPPLFWIFLGVTLLAGLGTIIWEVFTSTGRSWQLGFLLLLFYDFVLISLPALRGYLLYTDSDPLLHYALTRDILIYGHLSHHPDGSIINIYPILHIMMAELVKVTNTSLVVIMRLLPAFLTLLFMLSTFLLANAVWQNREKSILAAAATVTPLFGLHHIGIYPRSLGGFLFPLMIYLLIMVLRTKAMKYRAPFVFLLLGYSVLYFHWALMLIGLTLVLPVMKAIYDWRREPERKRALSRIFILCSKGAWVPVVLTTVATLLWISNTFAFDYNIRNMARILHENPYEPFTVKGSSMLGISGWDVPLFFLKSWGHLGIYVVLSLWAVVLLNKHISRREDGYGYAFSLIIWVIVGDLLAIVGLWLAYWGRGITTAILNREALLPLTPLFLGFLLHELGRNKRGKRVLTYTILAILLIALPATLASRSIYYSPWIYKPSEYPTRTNISAIRWLAAKRVKLLTINGLGFAPITTIFFVGGCEEQWRLEEEGKIIQIPMLRLSWYNRMDVPSHFGYTEHQNLADQRTMAGVIIITEQFRRALSDTTLSRGMVGPSQYCRLDFTLEDESLLRNDFTVYRIYSNGETDIYYVTAPPARAYIAPETPPTER